MFKTASLTDKGLKREINEDAYLVLEDKKLFLVSDGMGGHEKGEVASQLIVQTFQEDFLEDIFNEDNETLPCTTEDPDATLRYSEEKYKRNTVQYVLNEVIKKSTLKIIEYATTHEINVKMGATLVGIYALEELDEMVVFHLGDSRAYRIRDYKMEQLTTDHSKYEELKRKGYSEEELKDVSRSSITRAVGNFKVKELEISFVDLEKNDIFLLCSDGVSDLCSKEELLNEVLKATEDFNLACENIKQLVYERGARDNLTILLAQF